jgi:integrase-like protein
VWQLVHDGTCLAPRSNGLPWPADASYEAAGLWRWTLEQPSAVNSVQMLVLRPHNLSALDPRCRWGPGWVPLAFTVFEDDLMLRTPASDLACRRLAGGTTKDDLMLRTPASLLRTGHPVASLREPVLPEAREPKLLEQVGEAIRTRHYSLRAEEAYVGWIKRFIFFHGKRHPLEMGSGRSRSFCRHW